MKDRKHPCERWAEPISLAAAGCLSPDEERGVYRHAETCSDCRQRLRQLAELCGTLAEARLPADGVETAIVERVASAIASGGSEPPVVHTQEKAILPMVLTRSLDIWRWIMRSPVSRVAAAIIFALTLGGVLLLLHGSGAAVSFAQVVEQVLKVKSYQLKETDYEGDAVLAIYTRYWIAPGRSRTEIKYKDGDVKMVMIASQNSGKQDMTDLYPENKEAHVMAYVNLPERKTFFDQAHDLMLKAREKKTKVISLGKKTIEGRQAVGYRLIFDEKSYHTVEDTWADVETLLPVRIEITTTVSDDTQKTSPKGADGKTPGKRIIRSIWSDIRYNLKLDESLFSLVPPQGYKVVKHKTVVLPKPEKESKDSRAPMGSGTLVFMGEVEEEGKSEAKEAKPMNQGTLVPMGEEEKEGKPDARK
jgi:hypothetical protein